ncbi:hypothetical protein GPROT1_03761 [Gammaproteobacteria bacterium]|nr:hypothetical protein GPROT1_03761 [Gammaproteobacteria bacterium]
MQFSYVVRFDIPCAVCLNESLFIADLTCIVMQIFKVVCDCARSSNLFRYYAPFVRFNLLELLVKCLDLFKQPRLIDFFIYNI